MSPSIDHEVLINLFRERPALAQELLARLPGHIVPRGEPVVAEASFTQLAPTEFTADLVLLIGKPPTYGLIIEVQTTVNKQKGYVWPLYACALRARHRCPVAVLVVTPEASIARLAARPIPLDNAGSVFRPVVLGPSTIPRITSAEDARALPELAMLSALVHADDEQGLAIITATLQGLEMLPDALAALYTDMLLNARPEAMERYDMQGKYEYKSEFARKNRAEGLAEGLAEGRAKEARSLVLRQLARRCGLLGPELLARVEGLTLEQIELLAEDLLDFVTLADLEAWLEALPRA